MSFVLGALHDLPEVQLGLKGIAQVQAPQLVHSPRAAQQRLGWHTAHVQAVATREVLLDERTLGATPCKTRH